MTKEAKDTWEYIQEWKTKFGRYPKDADELASCIDFVIARKQPSLPEGLEEAALKAYPKMSRVSEPHGIIPADNKSHLLGDGNSEKREGFITGAMFELEKIKIAAKKAVENQDTAEKFLKSVGIMDENGNLSEIYR